MLYDLAYFIPDHYRQLFMIACMVTRAIGGVSSAFILSSTFAFFSMIYSDQRGKAPSARGCGINLGLSLGAVLGGCLFYVIGYFGVFLAFSLLTLTTMFVFFFPKTTGILKWRRGEVSLS